MKKNAGLLIVIILIIVNLIFGGSLLYIITVIDAPDIVASIKILELNENEIIIETEIKINNTNFFSIILGDFNINCKTENGLNFGNITIVGGEVFGWSNSRFINNGSFSFNNYNFEPLLNEIKGEIGFSFFGFIKKSVPINIILIAELEDVITDIKHPKQVVNTKGIQY